MAAGNDVRGGPAVAKRDAEKEIANACHPLINDSKVEGQQISKLYPIRFACPARANVRKRSLQIKPAIASGFNHGP
jgi:hypothetical protein